MTFHPNIDGVTVEDGVNSTTEVVLEIEGWANNKNDTIRVELREEKAREVASEIQSVLGE